MPLIFPTDSHPNLCLNYLKITSALAILLEHMHKKFEINRTKINGSCQSGRKVVPHNSKSDLPLVWFSDPRPVDPIFMENTNGKKMQNDCVSLRDDANIMQIFIAFPVAIRYNHAVNEEDIFHSTRAHVSASATTLYCACTIVEEPIEFIIYNTAEEVCAL